MSAGGPERAGADEGSSAPVAAEVDPSHAAASGRAFGDASDALELLTRELYWAGDPGARTPIDTGSVRERLHSFAHRLRIEAREMYPSSETGLDRSPRLRRRTKRGLWYGIRFATLRYDRLLAELAELNAQLAQRLAEAERELERLRGEGPDHEADG
jgi:hypothetical protein